jgi:KUP system potassium uptake protein
MSIQKPPSVSAADKPEDDPEDDLEDDPEDKPDRAPSDGTAASRPEQASDGRAVPPKRPTRESEEVTAGHTGARPIPPQLQQHPEERPTGRRLGLLTLTALGVVYGDIGTSPLYALRECFKPEYHLTPTAPNVYGVLSLIVWSLILIVSVKYIGFIMRADNRGEGGILALLALILQRQHRQSEQRRRTILIGLGLFGAALLYGDGVITPAISVLGAMEGLEVAIPHLHQYTVIGLSLAVIVGLFSFQRFGTDRVGRIFGPGMLLWFATIGTLGVIEIARAPRILLAVNPWDGVQFFVAHRGHGFVLLGAVVLAVTGAEALYADMGHFGKRPIRLAWFVMVLPCLLLNYFGQGAAILADPRSAENPFYRLAPSWSLIPLIVIATFAAVVASQALISGAFSLTQQCVQLGYSPRVSILHTSKQQAGQIYIPEVNTALALGCVFVVLFFRSTGALGAAYGIAVTGTMAITTALFYVISRQRFGWPRWKAASLSAALIFIDLAFFAANIRKIAEGGWVPLVIGILLFTLMTTWHKGRTVLRDKMRADSLSLQLFLQDVERRKPVRVSGTAVFMTSDAEGAPVVLLHHLKHNKVLHEQVILLSVTSAEVPEVSDGERLTTASLGSGFFRVTAKYGFMETPDVKQILARCQGAGISTKPMETSYYLGRERLIPNGPSPMPRWRKKVFVFMSRNARSATEFFGIPPNRVVELGTQIEF